MSPRKTYTGCWTCRSRRLKCDEERPSCRRCRSKDLHCEGYSARLQWISQSESASRQGHSSPLTKGLPRRRRLSASHIEALDHEAVVKHLAALDSAASRHTSARAGPFSILRFVQNDEECPEQRNDQDSPRPISSRSGVACESEQHITDRQSSSPRALRDAYTPAGADSSTPFASALTLGQHSTVNDSDPIPRFDSPGSAATAAPTTSMSVTLVNTLEDNLNEWQPPQLVASPTAQSSTPDDFLNPEIKLLLRHYGTHVLPIFSSLNNEKSPWRQLHFPSALRASIELEIMGSTAPTRQALLHSILTVSAYNLGNTRRQGNATECWSSVAARYAGETLRLLEGCIRDSTTSPPGAIAYNELMAAILSMVTVDVISGDTRSTELHLRACQALYRGLPNNDLSDVTDSIHTNFLYIRTMQEATQAFCNHVINASSPGYEDYADEESVCSLITQYKTPQDRFAWHSVEMNYGIPLELLTLVRKTTDLISMQRQLGQDIPVSGISSLEAEILDWPLHEVIQGFDAAPVSQESKLVMQHYTRAMHTAIVIYFCCKVQKVNPRHLQGYCSEVMSSLEAIQEVKRTYGMNTGHMPWPAFVAGALAKSHALRSRALEWFSAITCEGIGTSTLAKRALLYVWEQADSRRSWETIDTSALELVLT